MDLCIKKDWTLIAQDMWNIFIRGLMGMVIVIMFIMVVNFQIALKVIMAILLSPLIFGNVECNIVLQDEII